MDNAIYIMIFLCVIIIICINLSNISIHELFSNFKVPTLPRITVPQTTLPRTTLPRTTLPRTTVPKTTVPQTTVLQTTVPQTTVPRTTVSQTTVSQTTVPQTIVPQITVPKTTIPKTTVPKTTVPQTTVPQTTVPQTTVPQTTVPQTTVPKTTVPQTTVPQTTVPKTTVPQTTVPQTTVPQTTLSKINLSQTNFSKKYKLYGMNIALFNNKTSPNILNESNVRNVLYKIKDITPIIKTYNTSAVDILLKIITTDKLNMKVFINIWTEVYISKTILDSKIDVLIDIIKKYGTLNIDAISLTNEGFLRGGQYSQEDSNKGLLNIASGINRIRKELQTIKFNGNLITIPPIGICETVGFFNNRYNNFYDLNKYVYLMQRLDFIGVNIHPIYDTGSYILPNHAVNIVMSSYNKIKDNINKNYPNIKDIMITEVGMPTEGTLIQDVSFTKAKAKEFMKKITREMFNKNIKYYWFSAFDNTGKAGELFENKWGLFTMKSDPKNPNKYYQNQKFDISDLPNLYN